MSGRRKELERFDRAERLVHWSLGAIVLVLLATGLALYLPALALAVGHRALIENVHIYVGLALPVPLAVGIAGPWRRALLADVRRLNHWPRGEARWFRRREGREAPLLGKFNPGQKLSSAVLAGGLALMLVSGIIMRWAPPSMLPFQRGSTLVHDLVFVLIGVLVIGHVVMAFSHPEPLRSMWNGRISEAWARRHAPRWLDEKGDREPRRVVVRR